RPEPVAAAQPVAAAGPAGSEAAASEAADAREDAVAQRRAGRVALVGVERAVAVGVEALEQGLAPALAAGLDVGLERVELVRRELAGAVGVVDRDEQLEALAGVAELVDQHRALVRVQVAAAVGVEALDHAGDDVAEAAALDQERLAAGRARPRRVAAVIV